MDEYKCVRMNRPRVSEKKGLRSNGGIGKICPFFLTLQLGDQKRLNKIREKKNKKRNERERGKKKELKLRNKR